MTDKRRSAGDWIALLLRVFLGGFYIMAAVVKIPDPGKFAEAVANYRILPHEMINLVAITLPWVELLAGILLVLGIWFRASAILINCMTLVFILAIASAVARGLNIECGCFGTVGGRKVGLIALAEDIGLLACGVWLLWRTKRDIPAPSAVQEGASS
jgi:uncharacterized membrane protein YphA (DoxX/SURF4 family)